MATAAESLRSPSADTDRGGPPPTAPVADAVGVAQLAIVPVPAYPARPLVVGNAADPAERHADRIADEVITRLAVAESAASDRVDGATGMAAVTPRLRRSAEPVATYERSHSEWDRIDHSHLRRSAGGPVDGPEVGMAGGQISAGLASEIDNARGSGQPLDRPVREKLESAFGGRLSAVRVHTDDRAANLSRRVSARAFTVGHDIFFDSGQYQPDSRAGQHVLAHEIAHTRAPDAAAHRLVHRLAYDDDPRQWGNVAVKRSGEGQAGVYFVGPNRDLVVKPLASTGTVQYSNTFMQAVGLDAPESVRYNKGSAEGTAISALLLRATGTRSDTEVQQQIDDANAFLVMEKVSGKSIQSLDDAEAEEYLQNSGALKDTGKIMVADAFLGNSDRLVGGNVNLGNFFYDAATLISPGTIRTIDNEAQFKVSGTRRKRDGSKGVSSDLDNRIHLIELIKDPGSRGQVIGSYLAKFAQVHQNHAQTLALLQANRQAIIADISQGIDDALVDMARIFSTNMDLVRAVSRGYDDESAPSRNASTAKATARYIKAREGGDSEAEATSKLTKYVEYRAKRDKAPRGFKWVTKLVSKRGF